MKTWNYTSSPPPISTYIHQVCENNTHFFSGARSCWLHSRVVDTDGTKRDRYSWTWIEPQNWICLPGATHVRFYIRDIQSTHSLSWGWNNGIYLGFNDTVTVRRIHIYNHGETVNFHHYNDTKVGADGFTWYEYIYPIPTDINCCHMKVQIICTAGDWTFYDPSYFANMSFCVDDVEFLYGEPVYGPRLSELYGDFTIGPGLQMISLTTGTADIWFDIEDIVNIRTLETAGFTITVAAETFQFDYIAFNMRDQIGNGTHTPCSGGTWSRLWRDPLPRPPGSANEALYYTYLGAPYQGYVPLDDQDFRHALAHCIPKDEIIAVVYGGICGRSADSLVPEAQRLWFNPNVDGHPYNPGDPVMSTAGDGTACGILKAAGYVWDPDAPNPAPKHSVTDPDGNWIDPATGEPMNHITFAGVGAAQAPKSWLRDDLCVRDWRAIGLPIEHVVVPYAFLTDTMMDYYQFDMYALSWKVGRFPDHLHGFCHSSQNFCPEGYNLPGIEDPELDAVLEKLQHSTNIVEVKQACWDAQDMIAEKLPYLVTVTKPSVTASAAAAAPGLTDTLKGIVNKPGYGAENDWTFYDLYWENDVNPDTNPYGVCGTVNMIVGSVPTNYHPAYARTADEWKILGRIFDGLINVDPYTHVDIPWLATSWTIEEWSVDGVHPGMNTTFWLRDDVYYHDGAEFNASVVKFSLEFTRDQQIARARPMWQDLIDVQVHNPTCVSVYHNATSLWLFYHIAGPDPWTVNDAACWATMFPPHIYAGTSPAFRPEATINPLNPSLTCLVGTGPFVYRADSTLMAGGFAHLTAYRPQSSPVSTHWFMSVPEEDALLTEMFHWVGDVNSDGVIDIYDLSRAGKAFGTELGDALYDEDADIAPEPTYHENDDRVDMRDLAEIGKNWGKQRKYP